MTYICEDCATKLIEDANDLLADWMETFETFVSVTTSTSFLESCLSFAFKRRNAPYDREKRYWKRRVVAVVARLRELRSNELSES
jgi:hypothetical protein